MNIDQNGWQDGPEDEREALAQWEETQGDSAEIVVPAASLDKPVATEPVRNPRTYSRRAGLDRDPWSRAPMRVVSVIPWKAAAAAMVLLLPAGALAAQEQGAKHPLPAGDAPVFMSLAVEPLTGPEAGRASQIVLIRQDTTYLTPETLHHILQLAGWERRELGSGEHYTAADMHPRPVLDRCADHANNPAGANSSEARGGSRKAF